VISNLRSKEVADVDESMRKRNIQECFGLPEFPLAISNFLTFFQSNSPKQDG
jgi:hypothetical protein